MKRLKSLLPLLIAMILTVSIMFGSFGIFAFAEDTDPANYSEFFGGAASTMVTRVKEGEDFTAPAPNTTEGVIREVTDPVGLPVKGSGNTFVATQLGNYTVTYTSADKTNIYSYNVLSYEDKDYYVLVEETKDDFLPTYVKKGSEIKLPSFKLVYKNSKGKIVAVKNSKVDGSDVIGVDFSEAIASWNSDKTGIIVNKSGTLDLTFWGKLGAGTTKKFTKDYTINVQDDFENKTAPILGTLSVTSTANINALYTLPTASASDSYDSRVFIDVQVIDKDGKAVLDYEVDENGYAIVPSDKSGLDPIVFDNNEVRSFYPTEETTYKIMYTAYNGGGSSPDRKASSTHPYTVESRDRLAPVVVSIDSDKIPTKWGLNSVSYGVYNAETEKTTAKVRDNTNFTLPFPTLDDNADKEEDLIVTVTIVNPASRTLARWEGTVAEYKSESGVALYSPVTYNDYFREGKRDLAFKAGMDFSFDFFNLSTDTYTHTSAASKINTDIEKYGDWTITYSVKDTTDNGGSGTARKSFTVNLSKNYSYTTKPLIDENNLDIPKYVLINDENSTFTVPVIPMKSSDDLDLTFTYTMTSGAADSEVGKKVTSAEGIEYTTAKTFEIKRESTNNTIGGKEYSVEKIDGKYYALISKGAEDIAFILTNEIEFDFTAQDDVGNKFTLADSKIEKIANAGKIVVDMLFAADDLDTPEFAPDFSAFEVEETQQNTELFAGEFVIPGIKYADYTGFEISVLDSEGEPVSFKAFTYNLYNDDTDTYDIYVSDFRVIPKNTGDNFHRINIRVYDIAGRSAVYGFAFNVTPAPGKGGTTEDAKGTAAKVQDTGALRTEYELEKVYYVSDVSVNNVIVREVSGFGFGIMNNVFVGLESSTYYINDYVIENFDAFDGDWTDEDMLNAAHRKSYTVSVSNSEKPVIEVHGIVQKYVQTAVTPTSMNDYESGEFVELPVIIGYSKYENASIDVTVSFKGSEVDSGVKKIYYINAELEDPNIASNKTFESEDENGNAYTFSGIFAFAATADGDYTITVTAKVSSGEVSEKYTIKVGDRTPVSFTVDPSSAAAINSVFKRTKPTIDGNYSKFSITLKDPNGKIVTAAGLTLKASEMTNFANLYEKSEYTFTDAGSYTIVYTVFNENDETITSVKSYTLEVTSAGGGGTEPPVALTAVLIIIGVLLIAGVVVYVIRFRAVKK